MGNEVKKLGFGIIGSGNIGPFHAEAIANIEEAELRAVSDVVEERAKGLAAKYKADFYSDYKKLVERKDVEVVNICAPSGMHEEMALAAANDGKHVIIEKPLEITLPKCDRIIENCRKKKVKLCVIFPSRFTQATTGLKEVINKGRFGKLVLGDAYIKWYRSQEYYDSGGWRGTWKVDGGGALMNQSIHSVDLLQWMMGSVESVFAYSETLLRNIEVEDTAVALLRFKNGALGVIEGTTSVYPGLDARIEIHGEKGSVILEGKKVKFWEFMDQVEEDEKMRMIGQEDTSSGAKDPTKFMTSESHRLQILDMVKAIRNDSQPLVDGIEGRKAVEIILAVYESAKKGGVVKLPLGNL